MHARILWAAGALALTLAAGEAAWSQPTAPDCAPGTSLSVSATGEVRAAPNEATVRLGVQTQAPTAAEAFAANRAKMNATLAVLEAQGVLEQDIQTSGLSLSQQMIYHQDQAPKVSGYQASDNVVVQVHDLKRLGALLDAVVTAGANQLDGVDFDVSNRPALEDEARRKAVAAAQAKAELYATAAGYRIKSLRSLSEDGGQPFAPRPMVMAARMSAPATPVEGGQLTFEATVTADYELTR